MSKTRTTPFVMEPLGYSATSAEEVHTMMDHIFTYVKREKFEHCSTFTVRCHNNEVMGREFAQELYRRVIDDLGVPMLRVISPPFHGAAHLFEAAKDRPETLRIFATDSERTARIPSPNLKAYLELCNG